VPSTTSRAPNSEQRLPNGYVDPKAAVTVYMAHCDQTGAAIHRFPNEVRLQLAVRRRHLSNFDARGRQLGPGQ